MGKFNLLAALDGAPICTVSGRSARIKTIRTMDHERRLIVEVEGVLEKYTIHGEYNVNGLPSSMDLKMK